MPECSGLQPVWGWQDPQVSQLSPVSPNAPSGQSHKVQVALPEEVEASGPTLPNAHVRNPLGGPLPL